MVNTTPQTPSEPDPRQGNWAQPVNRLNLTGMPADAVNLNVAGRQVTSALQGFGQMWQKTYQMRLLGVQVPPREVVKVWKANFPSFWPKNNRFYSSGPIEAGSVALLNLAGPGGITAPGGAPVISTGILVIYSDEDQFSFLTPEGHMFAGMNTFSAYEEDGATVVQIQALIRASDPLYELTFRLGVGHKMEDDFWMATLHNLAAHFNASGTPTLTRVCVDPNVQWSQAKNIWQNAAVRTTVYLCGTPFRWAAKKLGGKRA